MSIYKCQCCKQRLQTRTLYKNGKPLRLCDFCDTQKPPAPKKPKVQEPPTIKRTVHAKITFKRIRRSSGGGT